MGLQAGDRRSSHKLNCNVVIQFTPFFYYVSSHLITTLNQGYLTTLPTFRLPLCSSSYTLNVLFTGLLSLAFISSLILFISFILV